MFSTRAFAGLIDTLDCAPWGATSGRSAGRAPVSASGPLPLYTPEQRRRRDASRWTLVQGVLAPVQFAVFAVSLVLVLHCLRSGEGREAAILSVVAKTAALYAIMITGSLWERDVFGRYLFARAFFWEDAVSLVVVALHTAYLVALLFGLLDTDRLLGLALAAYVTYVANAAQYVIKLREARLSAAASAPFGALGAAE